MNDLPYITSKYSGIGGELKRVPEDFVVREIPHYEFSGEGQHVIVEITKINYNTQDVVSDLQRVFEIDERCIGYAGKKDKNAKTSQFLSLDLGVLADLQMVSDKIANDLPHLSLESITRHINKLKLGHLIGNQFKILLRDIDKGNLSQMELVKDEILDKGFPNYFGPQRFGKENDKYGFEILKGERKTKKRWLKMLYLSAFQSKLFNEWLADRISSGEFGERIEGDRFIEKYNSVAGPIFGHKMTEATGDPGEKEKKILSEYELDSMLFKKFKLAGNRRVERVFPKSFSYEVLGDDICFEFILPKGCYATSLLREFIKERVVTI